MFLCCSSEAVKISETVVHSPYSRAPLKLNSISNFLLIDIFATSCSPRVPVLPITVTTLKFEKDLACYPWDEIFESKTPDEQSEIFHCFVRQKLDLYFPEKIVKLSTLDRKWMSPSLKQLHRRMQRAFHRKRGGEKYRKLKSKFKKMKKNAIRSFYSDFVSELKCTNPGKWYSMAKRIGAVDQIMQGEVKVESLSNLNNFQSAQKIAEHFASISNEDSPIDNSQLPCYLPALPPPQVEEYDVYTRLCQIKKTRSTLPIFKFF